MDWKFGSHALRGSGLAVILLFLGALGAAGIPAQAKIPGARHCYNDVCHRVLTLHETALRVGRAETVIASHYGPPERDASNPSRETSSGEMFRPDRDDNVASPVYPDGTRLLLWHAATGHAASVRVNNAGPYRDGRMLDTSEQLARKLGFYGRGIARLHVVVIGVPTPEEAEYRRGRSYLRVPGYLGKFASLELAMLADHTAVAALMGEAGGPPSARAEIAAEASVTVDAPIASHVARAVLSGRSAGGALPTTSAVKRTKTATTPRKALPVPMAVGAKPPAKADRAGASASAVLGNGHCVFDRSAGCH